MSDYEIIIIKSIQLSFSAHTVRSDVYLSWQCFYCSVSWPACLSPVAMRSDGTASRGAGADISVSVWGWEGVETCAVSVLSGDDITSVFGTLSVFLSQSDTEPWGAGRTTERQLNIMTCMNIMRDSIYISFFGWTQRKTFERTLPSKQFSPRWLS